MLCGMLRRERWTDLVDSDAETNAESGAALEEHSENPRIRADGRGGRQAIG